MNEHETITQLAESTTLEEWKQFQLTTNEGGRANCQDNWETFYIMRMSQFLTWTKPLLTSYLDDLQQARRSGRNLITEKYARMMKSTAPTTYEHTISKFLPTLPQQRQDQQEQIIRQQVAWARKFREQYPHLGANMRVLTTDQDTEETTSFETYLRGELSTYSTTTLNYYEMLISNIMQQHGNLTEITLQKTIRFYGYQSLQQAEQAQESSTKPAGATRQASSAS